MQPLLETAQAEGGGMSERRKARDARYNASEKGLARHTRYNHSVKGEERRRAQYWRRRDAGVCTKCGEPRLSESLCWLCLDGLKGIDEGPPLRPLKWPLKWLP